MKYKLIDPKINIVDFGPKMHVGKTIITPDDFVYGAAKITYQDVGALNELISLKKNDPEFAYEQVKKGLIKVAGAGHASMSTTPGFWCFLEGDSSKLVDSTFTGAVFASSLMPSGRRVPITKEAILIPKGISKLGDQAVKMYEKNSEDNIGIYEKIQQMGIPQQEASKIVQYGHTGGGFMFMPLETLIYFSKLAEKDPDAMPAEGIEIMSQIEDFIHKSGAGITYEARKAAPRTGNPNPNIFHFRKNLAQELYKLDFQRRGPSKILSVKDLQSDERKKRIKEYLEHREKTFKSPESINLHWKEVLGKLEDIVSDFNNSFSINVLTNTPWRVWGEVKRHRTMNQTAESIYNAVDRTKKIETFEEEMVEQVFSMPPSLDKNPQAKAMWINAFTNSVNTYFNLLEMGAKKSDAIAIIPRGIKLGIIKEFDLYNLTTGYGSLRLCGTAEPEMRKITETEMDLIKKEKAIGQDIKQLIGPKCHAVGFCPELSFERSCGKVKGVNPLYDKKTHNDLKATRIKNIEKTLDRANI